MPAQLDVLGHPILTSQVSPRGQSGLGQGELDLEGPQDRGVGWGCQGGRTDGG